MLEYTGPGEGAPLEMLVLHDDASASMPTARRAVARPKVGTFSQALDDEAKKKGWTVISMKNDWKRIFAFEQ